MPQQHDLDSLAPREQLADALRRADAEMRGCAPESLLDWPRITEPEQNRWGAMADVATAKQAAIVNAHVLAGGRITDIFPTVRS